MDFVNQRCAIAGNARRTCPVRSNYISRKETYHMCTPHCPLHCRDCESCLNDENSGHEPGNEEKKDNHVDGEVKKGGAL